MTYEEFRFSAPKGIVFIATRTYGPKGLGDMTFRWVRFSAPKGIVFIATDRTWYAIHPPIAPEEVSVPRRALSSLLPGMGLAAAIQATCLVSVPRRALSSLLLELVSLPIDRHQSFSAPKGIVFIAT